MGIVEVETGHPGTRRSRRLVRVEVALELLERLMPLPNGARIEGVRDSTKHRTIELLVHHEDLAIVPLGSETPLRDILVCQERTFAEFSSPTFASRMGWTKKGIRIEGSATPTAGLGEPDSTVRRDDWTRKRTQPKA